MKGTEGHSVVVPEVVVKEHESHSYGPHTNGIRVPSWGSPVKATPGGYMEGWGEGFLAFFITYLGKTARNNQKSAFEGADTRERKANSSPSSPFVTSRMREGT